MPASEPAGYPLDPAQRTDLVVGEPGRRSLQAGAGPSVQDVSTMLHVDDEPARANAAGWNCRVHAEYEAMAAVDWYVAEGTPVYATMDGTATLLINTWANGFDYYGVEREPYLGNPDRVRAPLSPFPGPGGGLGVYVSVTNDAYRTDYGHLAIDATVAGVPQDGERFFAPYTRTSEYRAAFAIPRPSSDAEQVAAWRVRRGDIIGYTGDAGYSEAPHLHYQITRLSDGAKLCPTGEPGFTDGGWLGR